MDYGDGNKDVIFTDDSWVSTTGAVRYNEFYHGEIIDYTIGEQERRPAALCSQSRDVLVAQQDEPVRIMEKLPARKMTVSPKGEIILDFGQNLAGVVEAHIKAQPGTKVVIRHGESLDENGNLYTTNLRTARATDIFICSGQEDVFRPRFTYHGFRYIAVEGLGQDQIKLEDFTACAIYTDLRRTGDFHCSNDLVNQLFRNINWSLKDNFVDVPTDCPQRDERLGYTGMRRYSCQLQHVCGMWNPSLKNGYVT